MLYWRAILLELSIIYSKSRAQKNHCHSRETPQPISDAIKKRSKTYFMPRVFICDKTLVLWSKVCSSLSGENVYACIFFQIRCISKTVVIFPYFLGASLPHTSSMPSIYKSFLPLLKNILCSSSLPGTWNLNMDIHVNIHDSFLKPAEIFAWHLAQFQCTPTCTLQLHFQMLTVLL